MNFRFKLDDSVPRYGITKRSSFLGTVRITFKIIPTVPKKELFLILPYLGTLLSNLKQKLRICFKNSLPQYNIKIILQLTHHLSSLLCLKDVIPKELQSHLVHKSSCGSCNVTYYGKTERHLNVRSSEHTGILQLTGKRVECKRSADSDHLLLHNHGSNFNDFTILCRDNNGFTLSIKESILISGDSSVLNENTASIPLLLFD